MTRENNYGLIVGRAKGVLALPGAMDMDYYTLGLIASNSIDSSFGSRHYNVEYTPVKAKLIEEAFASGRPEGLGDYIEGLLGSVEGPIAQPVDTPKIMVLPADMTINAIVKVAQRIAEGVTSTLAQGDYVDAIAVLTAMKIPAQSVLIGWILQTRFASIEPNEEHVTNGYVTTVEEATAMLQKVLDKVNIGK